MKRILAALVLLSLNVGAVLKSPGWNPRVKARLQKIIDSKRGSGLPVVFDFDNTLLCRDIGEATFRVLMKKGLLTLEGIPSDITPRGVRGHDLQETYDRFLEVTKHHPGDKAPYLNAYVWLEQIMVGLTPAQIVEATAEAYGEGNKTDDVTKPFLYPEMLELVEELHKAKYDIWVVSASNVWSVRFMVMHYLPMIPAEHVIGINSLLEDKNGKLYKDQFLMQENSLYAKQENEELQKYRVTTHVVYPVSAAYGKAANVLERIGKMPYLVAGDSQNDHGMLSLAKYKLWITRLDKPESLRLTSLFAQKNQPSSWMYQRTSTGSQPGFAK